MIFIFSLLSLSQTALQIWQGVKKDKNLLIDQLSLKRFQSGFVHTAIRSWFLKYLSPLMEPGLLGEKAHSRIAAG